MKLQSNSAVQWLRTTRCKWLLLVTVLCLVLRENYPFSHFPMYSSFSNETYFLYLTDAAGQPIATTRLGLSSSTLKKIFDRQRRSNLRKYRTADSARFRLADQAAAQSVLEYLDGLAAHVPSAGKLLQGARVQRAMVREKSGAVALETEALAKHP
ncbi:MAG TPA: hypothetical protein VGI60_08025 [Chthoniobacterales bacterium]|jgi:hypothetical protein